MLFALPSLAVFISAVLFNGDVVFASTHTDLDPGFLQCQECFFRGTPPQSLSELGLEQRCHRHLTGRPFASLYNTNCQTTVYTALHLSLNNGWGRGEQSMVRLGVFLSLSHCLGPLYRLEHAYLLKSHCCDSSVGFYYLTATAVVLNEYKNRL